MFFQERTRETISDVAQKSDEELLLLSVRKPEIFSFLVQRYQDAFLRKGRYILQNNEDAEDLVQETFVRIYIHAGSFQKRPHASFQSWAYKILLNQCFSLYKKKRIDKNFLTRINNEMAANIPDKHVVLQTERKLDVDYALSLISRLPNIFQKILVMYFIDDRPHREIAKKLNISEGAARVRLYRAKNEMKKEASLQGAHNFGGKLTVS